MVIEKHFNSVSGLKHFLENKRWECDGPEAFMEWLEAWAEGGVTAGYDDTAYSFMDLVDLV